MNVAFNVDEVFEMAQQIERNGARFYRMAAEATPDLDNRHLLLGLADMEEAHQKIFASMREDLVGSREFADTFDPQGEAASYLQAMADGHVFDTKADPADFLDDRQPILTTLRKAIGLEKDSIVFYQGMKEMVPENLGKDKIERIIREEMSHIVLLNRELVKRAHSAVDQPG